MASVWLWSSAASIITSWYILYAHCCSQGRSLLLLSLYINASRTEMFGKYENRSLSIYHRSHCSLSPKIPSAGAFRGFMNLILDFSLPTFSRRTDLFRAIDVQIISPENGPSWGVSQQTPRVHRVQDSKQTTATTAGNYRSACRPGSISTGLSSSPKASFHFLTITSLDVGVSSVLWKQPACRLLFQIRWTVSRLFCSSYCVSFGPYKSLPESVLVLSKDRLLWCCCRTFANVTTRQEDL